MSKRFSTSPLNSDFVHVLITHMYCNGCLFFKYSVQVFSELTVLYITHFDFVHV